jgi:DNA-directed RNA polymerase beta subunit
LFGLKKTLTAQVLESKFKRWQFQNPRLEKPKMTPREAFLKGITYEGDILVDIVETMGEKSFGSFAELKVVEIPNDVEWQIDEYDGAEWVAEVHRTWR